MNIKLVCFDVDDTLVSGTSWFFLTEGLGCSLQKHNELYMAAKRGEFSFQEAERRLIKMYRESGNATREFIQGLFKTVHLEDGATEIVSYLKQKKYYVHLISGAVDMYVREVAQQVNADGFHTNSFLEFDEQGVLEKINYRDEQAKVKVEQLEHLVGQLGISLSEVAFVGDGENDIEVFKATGHGIAMHSSSHELMRVAWKIVDSLGQLKHVL